MLNANETDKTLTASKKQSSLTGMFDREQLTLSGVPSQLNECQKIAQIPEVLIQGAVREGVITGKIRLGSG